MKHLVAALVMTAFGAVAFAQGTTPPATSSAPAASATTKEKQADVKAATQAGSGSSASTQKTAAEQVASLNEVRRTRDGKAVVSTLAALREACRSGANIMPPLVEAVKAYATVGEISDVMREVFETWQEPAIF